MSQIDKYIKKATAGLPTRERLDTSAELRVHLNAQVKKHMLEGHSQEEAEFLAVDAMGAVAPVNRQFLGHTFTPRVGWGLVIAAVVGVSSWLLWTNQERFFMANGFIEPAPVNETRAVAIATGLNTTVLDVLAPLGAKEVTFAFITPNQESKITKEFFWDSRKTRLFISSDAGFEKCRRLMIGSNERRIDTTICAPEPIAQSEGGGSPWTGLEFLYPKQVQLNTWIPIFVVKPNVLEQRGDNTVVFSGNTLTRHWSGLYARFQDTTDGCWNCLAHYKFLKLPDRQMFFGAPDLILENALPKGDGVSDLIEFRVPAQTIQIDAAIHRHGQKPVLFEDVIAPQIDKNLIAGFGVYDLQTKPLTSQRWNVRLGYSSKGEFVDAAQSAELTSSEFTLPDKLIPSLKARYSGIANLPSKIPLDTWIPVWSLPTLKNPDLSPNPSIDDFSFDPNKWFIGYLRFLTKPAINKNVFPRYKIKSARNPQVGLLETIR
jgi:hypothetical protein